MRNMRKRITTLKVRPIKRLGFGAFAVAFAAAFVALGTGGGTFASAAAKKFSIAYVPGATGVGFYTSLSDGMQAEASKLGMSYSYQGSPTFTPSKQTPVVDAVCTRHPSVLVLSPTTPVSMGRAVDTCVKDGVSVITTDTGLKTRKHVVSAITSTSTVGGEIAAGFIGTRLRGRGQVAILNISATATTQVERQQGFEKVLKAKFPHVKIVAIDTAAQSVSASTSAFESMMLAHPAIRAVFSASGTGALGVAAAFKTDGLQGKVLNVGYDATATEVALLKSGAESATVAQQPTKEGMLAAEFAHDFVTGRKSAIKKTVDLRDVLLTSARAKNPAWAKYFYKS